mmetsp:Transcript_18535/g.46421  ORF Transcript_18535/g.46421 Transcript_18535/m.46421 type:complete len:202 (+) Transcript_18535:247-852(+)
MCVQQEPTKWRERASARTWSPAGEFHRAGSGLRRGRSLERDVRFHAPLVVEQILGCLFSNVPSLCFERLRVRRVEIVVYPHLLAGLRGRDGDERRVERQRRRRLDLSLAKRVCQVVRAVDGDVPFAVPVQRDRLARLERVGRPEGRPVLHRLVDDPRLPLPLAPPGTSGARAADGRRLHQLRIEEARLLGRRLAGGGVLGR